MDQIDLILIGLFVSSAIFAQWFARRGLRNWEKMTDDEKLKAIARWRSAG